VHEFSGLYISNSLVSVVTTFLCIFYNKNVAIFAALTSATSNLFIKNLHGLLVLLNANVHVVCHSTGAADQATNLCFDMLKSKVTN
jgi:hypothetical protein